MAVPQMDVLPAFWQGKRVLITGHTGFKGAWLAHWLLRMGAEVTGIALAPETTPNLFDVLRLEDRLTGHHLIDIRDASLLVAPVAAADPEIVFHLAAQPLVRRAFTKPLETFDTNVMGSANVLEAVRDTKALRAIIAVTTDKVYENREWVWPYRETDALGGYEPYGASKAAAEMVIQAYRASYFQPAGVALTSVRAGNVIGGGDWSANRIVPDIVRAMTAGEALILRNPAATRPWQHVFEPLLGYMMLAQQAWDSPNEVSTGLNFGPDPADTRPVCDLVDRAVEAWGDDNNPMDVLIQPARDIKESQLLSLDSSQVKALTGWTPRWGFDPCVNETIRWYRKHLDGADMVAISDAQIDHFMATRTGTE